MRIIFAISIMLVAITFEVTRADDMPTIDPESPFRLGETLADNPATCENLAYWAEHAPDYNGRITMTIKSPILASQWDGALAYLLMCDEPGVQVLCVTYREHVVDPKIPVVVAGGYERVGAKQIMLDPCLAFDE